MDSTNADNFVKIAPRMRPCGRLPADVYIPKIRKIYSFCLQVLGFHAHPAPMCVQFGVE